MRPIEIVGGGLAGLALGRALVARGVEVTLHEALDYPRHRVCGEFMCGLGSDVVETLGLEPILQGAVRHRTMAWFRREREVGRSRLPTAAIGLSRLAFDDRLASDFVAGGGRLRTRSRVGGREDAPGRVWATGRRAGAGEWIGLKTHCRGLSTCADLDFHLSPGAYVGASKVEDDAVNVCGLFRRRSDVRAAADRVLVEYLRANGLSTFAGQVEATLVRGAQAAVAALDFAHRHEEGRVVLGDAFGMIPPFTGNGMAIALESAALALHPCLEYAQRGIDWDVVVREVELRLRRRFRHRLRLARLLQSVMTSGRGQACLALALRGGFLPFRLLFRQLH
ncbi:hypothetical protein ASA1KI_29060 [Opitutales bacterium ASA1]|uniref:NAD(P)/FAD-dependent oxidoreductase n=1 Tax=Congregicoccus parvus TaxID=3081749 RepID=UPI002B2CC410|nr:hypothetical protein ASA1KI_29060 [Opitutales bacterium ASA1]